ncbi:hypothetical protein R3W88_010023 [Solanum pinnatisectum]|uniref:Uncharacterized protein n=1 Tax=Solanum pinnatisectum TaxID=50273 RepID=A0AAV9MGD3_9SOLN|nr:hypothetical protein R3W88_010023 [Solanum pinnatisectum]
MVNARQVAEPNIFWKINSGSCNMWWDNWCEKGPLAILFPDHVHNNNAKVMDSIDVGNWNRNKLREDLPEHIVLYIANIPIGDANDNDYAVWNITQDGQYTNCSAWQSIREVRQKDGILSKVWHKILFNAWWNMNTANSVHKMVQQITPMCIAWEI